jgi:hypothetical protein
MGEEHHLRARPESSHEEALPLPSGTPLYESLTSRFIAFDRLLSTLADTRYSGYVRLVAPDGNGVILLRDGSVIDSLHRSGQTLLSGEEALRAVERSVETGAGVLDVVGLEGGLVEGLHHLASGVAAYPDMRASWVNIEGLVKFLQQRRFTGAISVRADAGAGVIMLDDGKVGGAFTTASRTMDADPAAVMAMCSDPEAQVEVHAGQARPTEAPAAAGAAETASGDGDGSPVGSAVSRIFS